MSSMPVSVPTWFEHFRKAPKPQGGPLTPGVVAVAYALATFAHWADGSGARPSQATLALGAGVRRETAGRALKELVGLGWVEVTGQHGAVAVYRLTVPGEV